MPRSHWKQKNPYCRKSKLTKSGFESVVFYYFNEILENKSRVECCRELNIGCEGVRISRQSLGRYFDKLSAYIWNHMVLAEDPGYADMSAMSELHDFIYGRSPSISSQNDVVYRYIDEGDGLRETEEPVVRSLMFDFLIRRSKAANGIGKKRLHLEFSRVFFMCSVIEVRGIRFNVGEEFSDKDLRGELNKIFNGVLLGLLNVHPLQ